MKKILAVLLTLILVFAFCAMPSSAETKASEWKKGSGAVSLDFSDEGTKVIFEEGVCIAYYQNRVNLRDFTVKLKVNAPKIHDEWGAFFMTIGGNGGFTERGFTQNFLLFYPLANGIEIHPQVLHSGIGGIEPATRVMNISLEDDLTLHFKKVSDYMYSVTVNETATFEYSIPENFNWVEDVSGEGCIGFGGRVGQVYAENNGLNVGDYNVLVKEINGVKMNGKNETTSGSNNTTGGSNNTTGGSTVDPDTGLNVGIIGGDTTGDTTTDVATEGENNQGFIILLVSIIVGGVILALALVLVIILVLKKKSTATEEVVEEVAEETTEE